MKMKRRRRSLLFISGNSPKGIQDAPVFDPDAVVFDLNDRVSIDNKDSARYLVKEALHFLDYSKVEVMVRINPLDTEFGAKDVDLVARVKPNAIIVSKATSEGLVEIDHKLTQIEKEEGFPEGTIELIPALETAFSIEYVKKIITSSPRITAAWFNAEGLLAEFGSKRTKTGEEILYARSRIGIACRAEGIDVIDTLFLDGNDYEGLEKDALQSKSLGFTGKAAFDGRQIDIINLLF
jgi:citrate lyase subunit beta / citryl-CoA lyase